MTRPFGAARPLWAALAAFTLVLTATTAVRAQDDTDTGDDGAAIAQARFPGSQVPLNPRVTGDLRFTTPGYPTRETGTPEQFYYLNNPLTGRIPLWIDRQDCITFRYNVRILGNLQHDGTRLGFFGATVTTRPIVRGSWSDGSGAKSLAAALEKLGLVKVETVD